MKAALYFMFLSSLFSIAANRKGYFTACALLYIYAWIAFFIAHV